MKKILITGANSYVGDCVKNYLINKNEGFKVSVLDQINPDWIKEDFSVYDVIYHVSGIAHSDSGKISESKAALYDKVNHVLVAETAKKAKAEGVKQFIFMSSAIVYGESSKTGGKKVIERDTPLAPANAYGKSKQDAEKDVLALSDKDFKTVILRCPMIYGKNCKGNYNALRKIALKLKFFPYVKNQRSMLYIENLCEFVYLMIKNGESGIFFPSNKEYSNTSEMIKLIAAAHGKKTVLVKGFTPILKFLGLFTSKVSKAFGSLSYDEKISEYEVDYRVKTLSESIAEIETETEI